MNHQRKPVKSGFFGLIRKVIVALLQRKNSVVAPFEGCRAASVSTGLSTGVERLRKVRISCLFLDAGHGAAVYSMTAAAGDPGRISSPRKGPTPCHEADVSAAQPPAQARTRI